MRYDLKQHRNAGRIIGLLVSLAVAWALIAFTPAPAPLAAAVGSILGFGAAAAAGWLKEYWWDAAGRGNVDREDYKWTARGGAEGAAVAFVVALASWVLL